VSRRRYTSPPKSRVPARCPRDGSPLTADHIATHDVAFNDQLVRVASTSAATPVRSWRNDTRTVAPRRRNPAATILTAQRIRDILRRDKSVCVACGAESVIVDRIDPKLEWVRWNMYGSCLDCVQTRGNNPTGNLEILTRIVGTHPIRDIRQTAGRVLKAASYKANRNKGVGDTVEDVME